jgi:hypothetical protein
MNDLMKMAMSATAKNIRTKKSSTSIVDIMFKLLKDGQKIDRQELIGLISLERAKEEYPDLDSTKLAELIENGEFKKINTTCKNGLDTAVCKGKGQSSFWSNRDYQDYELIKDGRTLSIIKKK